MKRFLLLFVLWMVAAPAIAEEFQTGVDAFSKRDYATALHIFKAHADAGDAAAQFNIGFMYRKGLGVAKNDATAVEWWHKSAEQGFEAAQESLIFMYTYGLGIKVNNAEAAFWQNEINKARMPKPEAKEVEVDTNVDDVDTLQVAAQQGNPEAQVRLAKLYESGTGVPQDFVKAHAWYNLAALRKSRGTPFPSE